MTQKRKASSEGFPDSKRLRKSAVHNSEDDPIYEETYSDADFTYSDEISVASDDAQHDTPATPFSPSSAKYPSELKTHRCPFEGCTKAFNRPARLQEHLRSHNNERIFDCQYAGCDKTFLRASHLNHHVKSAHTGVRDYVCDRPGCGKSFVTGSRLRRHLAAHDGRDKYRCTEYPPCNETFRKHGTLQKHIMSVHLNQKPFPCSHIDPTTGEKCPMAFDTAGHLRAHEGRVHAEKRFSCTECSQQAQGTSSTTANSSVTFPTYALLQAHIKSAHPPQCPTCSISCSSSRELRRHLEVAHGDVSLEERRVFDCTVPGCGRSFTKKGNLTVHIRTVHNGEKRFVCGETDLSSSQKVQGWDGEGCGKQYGSKLALEEHIRTAHLGLLNAKAERRQRLGQAKGKAQSKAKPFAPSTLAALTGEGYAEETGRHIACFIQSCEHRFHRDYDLWVHMSGKHGCSEDEIQNLFMQRALLADEDSNSNFLGIYGLEFDTEDQPYEPFLTGDAASNRKIDPTCADGYVFDKGFDASDLHERADQGHDSIMHDSYSVGQGDVGSMIPSDDMALIDPVLAYNMMDG